MAHVRRSQLAAIGIHYVYYPLDYMLDAQAKAGYRTIELLGQAPHYLIDDEGFQDPAEIRRKVEDRGMRIGVFTPECAVYHYRINLADEGAHARSMEYFKRAFEAAEGMGAHILLTNAIGATFDEEHERGYDRAVRSFAYLAPYAADHGVTIAVESVRPEESRICITLDEIAQLIEDVDRPSVRAGLDTVAMGVAGETPRQWFERLGDKIVHCHWIDGRPYAHLVWGDGVYPLERYLDVLNEFGYEGYLGQEITDGRYFDDPAEADRRNFDAFRPYLVEEE
jgi:protein FrlC